MQSNFQSNPALHRIQRAESYNPTTLGTRKNLKTKAHLLLQGPKEIQTIGVEFLFTVVPKYQPVLGSVYTVLRAVLLF